MGNHLGEERVVDDKLLSILEVKVCSMRILNEEVIESEVTYQ